MDEMRAETGSAVILITHDLGVVAERCDRVAVMYAGQIVETALASEIFSRSAHPYTQALLACVPAIDAPIIPDVPLPFLAGQPPALTLAAMPPGCPFEPRCASRMSQCRAAAPLESVVGDSPTHRVRCFLNA